MTVFVLDTDHCVAVLRGQLHLADKVGPDEELAVTAITLGELIWGARRSRKVEENLDAIRRLLESVRVLSLDREAAERFGNLKAGLEAEGAPLGDFDLLIASIALVHDATLVTHNFRHFSRIEGLKLADWL